MTGPVTVADAALEIGELVNRILALAPKAGLHVGIKIEPAAKSRSESGK